MKKGPSTLPKWSKNIMPVPPPPPPVPPPSTVNQRSKQQEQSAPKKEASGFADKLRAKVVVRSQKNMIVSLDHKFFLTCTY